MAADLGRLVRAGREAGCTQFFTYTKSTRRDSTWPHTDQLSTVERTLRLDDVRQP